MNLKEQGFTADDFSYTGNGDELRKWKRCGCLSCRAVFDVSEISWWVNERHVAGQTAFCPRCNVDMVFAAKRGIELSSDTFIEIDRLLEDEAEKAYIEMFGSEDLSSVEKPNDVEVFIKRAFATAQSSRTN